MIQFPKGVWARKVNLGSSAMIFLGLPEVGVIRPCNLWSLMKNWYYHSSTNLVLPPVAEPPRTFSNSYAVAKGDVPFFIQRGDVHLLPAYFYFASVISVVTSIGRNGVHASAPKYITAWL